MSKRYLMLVLLIVFSLILSACGGKDEDPTPTPRPQGFPSITPVNTAIAGVQSPTPLPTFPQNFPTFTPFNFPTFSVPPTLPSRLPESIQINSPANNGILLGNATVFGSASHPDFVQYALEYGPEPNNSNLWYPITPQAVTVAVLNGALGAWNTTLVPDGFYQVRLHVYLTGGREVTNVVVRNLQVRNSSITTSTPSGTNRSPIVSPVAAFKMIKGTSATVALGIFDPDGDTTSFTARSDNSTVLSISPAGQAVTLYALNVGVATVTVTATDGRGATATMSFIVSVENPTQANNPPNINPIPNQTLQKGTVISVGVVTSDPDGDAVNFTVASNAPNIVGVSKNGSNINLSGVDTGSATISITATDARGATRTAIFSVVVNPAAPTNNPPSIGAIPAQTVDRDKEKDIAISVSDPDGDTLAVSAASSDNTKVSVVSANTTTLRIRGVAAGSATITLSVKDSKGATASTTFSVTVNAPQPTNRNPQINTIANQTVEVGKSVRVDFVASDPDGDSLTFAASSANPNVATVNTVDNDSINVVGASAGSTSVTVIVTDGKGGSATTTFNVTVNAAQQQNQNPVIAAIPDQTLNVGETKSITLDMSDPDGGAVTFAPTTSNAGVVSVLTTGNRKVDITGTGAGSATVRIDVSDGVGGSASTTFNVTVNQPAPTNQSPVISPIGDQTVQVGQSIQVAVTASDPDGDQLTISASSNNANATVSGTTTLTVTGVNAGQSTITVTANDGRGGTASTTFGVTVNAAPVNNSPVIDPIANQSVDVGASGSVGVTASDPDGDPLSISAASSNNGIATASYAGGNVNFTGVSAGDATITVTAEDGKGGVTTANFTLTVSQPAPSNNPPVVSGIGGQTLEVGQQITVPVSATDPDGDPLTISVSSDNTNIAAVTFDTATNNISIKGTGEGTTTINVTADDGRGGTNGTSFSVMVNAPAPTNTNPVLDPIADQVVEVGQAIDVAISASDPDGDQLTVTVGSADEGIATAFWDGSSVQVSGISVGGTSINVAVDDGKGGTASTSFGVTVSAGFDITIYPELPDYKPNQLRDIYQDGQTQGRLNTVFSVVGDDAVHSTDYLDAFADPAQTNLNGQTNLQTTIDHYTGSWNATSVATGNGWTVETVLDPNAVSSNPDCQAGETPLTCEIRLRNPAVIIISFQPRSIANIDPATFRAKLQEIVDVSKGAGVIPVLVTFPNDGEVGLNRINNFNQIIIEVAEANTVPVWNLYLTMDGVNGVYSVGGTGPGDLSADGGYNRRNRATLLILEDFRARLFN